MRLFLYALARVCCVCVDVRCVSHLVGRWEGGAGQPIVPRCSFALRNFNSISHVLFAFFSALARRLLYCFLAKVRAYIRDE